MAEISGVQGSILAGGVALEASDCSYDGDQAVVDRTHFGTGGEPVNAAGQRTGSISASGPVSTTSSLAARGVVRGALVTFALRITPSLGVVVQGRVSKVSYSNSHNDGPKWTVNATQWGAAAITGV